MSVSCGTLDPSLPSAFSGGSVVLHNFGPSDVPVTVVGYGNTVIRARSHQLSVFIVMISQSQSCAVDSLMPGPVLPGLRSVQVHRVRIGCGALDPGLPP